MGIRSQNFKKLQLLMGYHMLLSFPRICHRVIDSHHRLVISVIQSDIHRLCRIWFVSTIPFHLSHAEVAVFYHQKRACLIVIRRKNNFNERASLVGCSSHIGKKDYCNVYYFCSPATQNQCPSIITDPRPKLFICITFDSPRYER